ncbi:hypothetical protein ACLOJK_023076 [Asimina triloba]
MQPFVSLGDEGSSSIKVRDEKTGAVYSVGAHDVGSASSTDTGFFSRRALAKF